MHIGAQVALLVCLSRASNAVLTQSREATRQTITIGPVVITRSSRRDRAGRGHRRPDNVGIRD